MSGSRNSTEDANMRKGENQFHRFPICAFRSRTPHETDGESFAYRIENKSQMCWGGHGMTSCGVRTVLASALLALAVLAAGPVASAGTIGDAADWLVGHQNADGSFPWTVGGGVYSNVQAPPGMGLFRAYQATGNTTYLDAAKKTGDYLLTKPKKYSDGDMRFATHDPMFLELLGGSYASFLQTEFWDKLTAGTYGESNDMDAAAWGSSVVSGRTSQGIVELSPWDLSASAIGAHIGGETAIRNALMGAILDGLEATGSSDTDYDLIGLAGAIWASAVTGIDLDPTAGRWASAGSTSDLADTLNAYIAPNGGWVYNTTAALTSDNADTQTTAFALLGLFALDPSAYASQIEDGLAYLRSVQNASGQFLVWPGASTTAAGGVETHGEALHAYSVVVPTPSAGLLGLTLLGGLGVIASIRRRGSRRKGA